jgi:hypothetical protein
MTLDLSSRVARLLISYVVCGVLVAGLVGAAKKPAPKPKKEPAERAYSDLPWTLRPHMGLTMGDETLILAEDNAEWRVVRKDETVLADNVLYTITLGDGTVLNDRDFETGKTDRSKFSTPIGDGTQYIIHRTAKKGLSMQYVLSVYSLPFYVFQLQVTNDSKAPIVVKKISSAILGEKSLPNASSSLELIPRRMTQRGPYPVFDTAAQPLIVLFHDKTQNRTLSLGILPKGAARSGAAFAANGAVISGEVSSTFDPPIVLAPGQTLEADPVWISFNVPDASSIDMNFAWTQSTVSRPKTSETPRLFVSTSKATSVEDLLAAARRWSEAGCTGALVPSGWELAPGSLEGGGAGYPKSMGSVARDLKAAKLSPGIVIDPLLLTMSNPAFCVDVEGRKWCNLTNAEAKAEAVRQLKKASDWGFEFFAIEPSIVPDAVLHAMNITREQAESLAFEVMAAAAEGKPVFPASRVRLAASSEAWLEAAACMARMKEYGVPMGPVTLNADGGFSASDEVLAAIASYTGPIELIGNPTDGLPRKLAKLLAKDSQSAKAPVKSADKR